VSAATLPVAGAPTIDREADRDVEIAPADAEAEALDAYSHTIADVVERLAPSVANLRVVRATRATARLFAPIRCSLLYIVVDPKELVSRTDLDREGESPPRYHHRGSERHTGVIRSLMRTDWRRIIAVLGQRPREDPPGHLL
jgi:hypothetical protein